MATATRIEIVQPRRERIEVDIEGTAPLLVNQFDRKTQTEMEERQQMRERTTKKKSVRVPEEEFEASRYRLPDGSDGVPCNWFKKGIIDAGYRFLNLHKVDLNGIVHVTHRDLSSPGFNGHRSEELLLLEASAPEMDTRYVRLAGPGRTADIRYRAIYGPWRVTVPITFMPERIPVEQVVSALSYMGFAGGIGELRPGKSGGSFGTFTVVEVRAA